MVNESGITSSSVVVWNQNHLSAEVDGEIVLMSVAEGRYVGFDAIGSDVWRQLAQPVRVSDLCASLAERYEAESGVIESDVLELLAELRERDFVEVRE